MSVGHIRWSKTRAAINRGYGFGFHPERMFEPPYGYPPHNKRSVVRGGDMSSFLSGISDAIQKNGVDIVNNFADRVKTSVNDTLSDPQKLENVISTYGPKIVSGIKSFVDARRKRQAPDRKKIKNYLLWLKTNDPQAFYEKMRQVQNRILTKEREPAALPG